MKRTKTKSQQKTLYAFFNPHQDKPRRVLSGLSSYDPKKHRKESIANSQSIRHKNNYIHTRAHKGVLYVALNEFREFIAINLFSRLDSISNSIVPSGEKIAEATVDDDDALTFISVDPRFRRQKIGSELIRFMKQRCEQFHVFGGQECNSRYRLTREGMALIRYCLAQAILKHEDFIGSDAPVPSSPGKRRL